MEPEEEQIITEGLGQPTQITQGYGSLGGSPTPRGPLPRILRKYGGDDSIRKYGGDSYDG